MTRTVLLVATLDTKGDELAFVRELIVRRGHNALVLDAGIMRDPPEPPDVAASEVAAAGGTPLAGLRERGDRGSALEVMARGAAALARQLFAAGRIDAVLGIGGSCGTSIATAAMRELPVGVPKVMVSTMASGQVAPYVGVKDIMMLYAVVDIAGLNRVSRRILGNAAGAVCGMLEQPLPTANDKPVIAATMFGVTTPCVERVRKQFESAGYEVLVFHATGSGGRAMEGLVGGGFITGVADVTTTEWADELVGGVLSAGPERLDAAAATGTPQVVSLGALDMVNFGAKETIPEKFRGRKLHIHNPNVTLMRTTAEECARLGQIIARKLGRCTGPATLVVPLRGVSAIDKPGENFYDAEADAALFAAIRANVAPNVKLVEVDLHINDPEFANVIVSELLVNMEAGKGAVHNA